MKFIRTILVAIVATILSAMQLCAQSLKVLSVNDGAYPEIVVRVKIQGFADDSISILERGNAVECSAEESAVSSIGSDERMFVFLVEDSYYFHHNGIFPSIKKALLDICSNLGKSDNANILFFGTPGRNLKFLSAGQTNDSKLLACNVDDFFLPQVDSTFIDNRLYESIEEALDYVRGRGFSNGAIVFTIISRGLNLSKVRSFSEGFVQKAVATGIYANVLMYDSESHNSKRELENLAQSCDGDFTLFDASNLEAKLAQVLEKMGKAKPKNLSKEMVLKFNATQEGLSNGFVIKYGSSESLGEYTNPNRSGLLGKYPIVVVIIISLLLILSAVILYMKTKTKVLRHIDAQTQAHVKEIQAQNRELRREIEKFKKHPVSVLRSFDKFNIEENLVGSGKMVPKLLVQDHDDKKVFELGKMIMTIGRKESNDIVIPNRTVSGSHATLSFEGGVFYITDNNSTNGTFINDIKITKGKICPNDIVRLGSVFAKINY